MKTKIIIIPLTLEAVYRLNYNQNIAGDLLEIILDEGEYDELCTLGVFDSINAKLSLNIGDYEDELIFNNKFKNLEEVLNHFGQIYPTNLVLKKFQFICQIAFSLNTALFFSF